MYDHRSVEEKWRKKWEEADLFHIDLYKAEKPFYNLMMFPYPSAQGLHVGNVFAYTGADIYGRFKRMQGYDVFEPMGFDAFGIHSENYALKIGDHPAKMVPRNIKRFREEQLKRIGAMFDWGREVQTTDPKYYKWTQYLFLKLYEHGLAYRKKAPVNWCPSCKTVLADEQVIAGECERCGTPVETKEMEQWFFRITAYADKLYENLDKIDWTRKTVLAQKQWIGKSVGALIKFPLESGEGYVEVFTTRPDTLFGATYVVLSPEHPMVERLTSEEQKSAVTEYVERFKRKSYREKKEAVDRSKTGVFTGGHVRHPFTGEKLPVWIADYVLMEYGTGAIMAVPAHDERDYEFAKIHSLPIKPVVRPVDSELELPLEKAYVESGVLINSGEFTGMPSEEAKWKITAKLEEKGLGKKHVTFRLHDWCISRQRYWGPPIPIIYCDKCGVVPVPVEDLPVELPYIEKYQPDGSGNSRLARVESFYRVKCPKCGGEARRETDVSDNFLDSAWYFLRYLDPDYEEGPFNPELVEKWMPVDMYIGGHEHAVLHLLYTRFITMALKDMGLLNFEEPFKKFRAHGLILKDGAKMAKHKGNVVNPDEYIDRYGADTFRTYLMFLGPYTQGGDFRDKDIVGVRKFLDRVYEFFTSDGFVDGGRDDRELLYHHHKTVKKVTEDIENLKYNTAIAALMEYLNYLTKTGKKYNWVREDFIKLLSPFAPFITEEIYHTFSDRGFLVDQQWPAYDERWISVEEVEVVVQVNGKVRGRVKVRAGADEEEVFTVAKEVPTVKKYLEQGELVKRIYVKDRLLSLVVK